MSGPETSKDGDSSEHREKELKFALESAQDYERLAQVLPGFLGEVVQENHYWDLPNGTLGEHGIMLRLRLEAGSALITVKRRATRSEAGLFQADEHEETIPYATGEGIVAGTKHIAAVGSDVVKKLADELGDLTALECWGSLTNRRRRYQLDDDLVAELDHTVFLENQEEWEVELECHDTDRGQKLLLGHLAGAGIRYRPQTLSKSARLHATLEARRSRS